MIIGDAFFKNDLSTNHYSYPFLINLPIYINLPLLIIFLFEIILIMGNHESLLVLSLFENYINIDIINVKNQITIIDKISLIIIGGLFIGIIGTVPGHELTHRKKNKFDMFFGNLLLSLSWDCSFALEHVYGHHKNVGLSSDPATAKRNENIYLFIIRASLREHYDAWKIELKHLKRRGYNQFGIYNKMILGYIRSSIFTFISWLIGGVIGMLFYLLCAIIAKALLEVINYVEHYGLVRASNQPVFPRHSWNANNMISSLLLYNVTRHSAHHEKANLKFWELKPYPDAPTMPYGYLTMLYIAFFLPFVFHKIMIKKLIDWDENYATEEERRIINFEKK